MKRGVHAFVIIVTLLCLFMILSFIIYPIDVDSCLTKNNKSLLEWLVVNSVCKETVEGLITHEVFLLLKCRSSGPMMSNDP